MKTKMGFDLLLDEDFDAGVGEDELMVHLCETHIELRGDPKQIVAVRYQPEMEV